VSLSGVGASGSLSYTNVSLTFDASGSAPLPLNYSDVGQLGLNARLTLAASSVEPAITLVAPEAVTVSKPFRIRVNSVTAASGSPANPASSASGSGFIAAGQPFRLVLDVENALGNRTPNFGRETTPAALNVAFVQQVYPAAGTASSATLLNTGSFSAVSGSAGSFANNQLYYLQAGSFTLKGQLSNNNYLGAGNVVEQPISASIGRFFPESFVLNTPTVAAICQSGSAPFSYLGQPGIALSFALQAQSAAPPGYSRVVLADYDADLYQQTADVAIVAENDSSPYSGNLQNRLSGVPVVRWKNGIYQFSAGATLQLDRKLAADLQTTVPDGPFNALQWGIRVTDTLDNRQLSVLNMHAGSAGVCPASDCDAAKLGTLQQFYYGRLVLMHAYGSASQPLPLSLQAELWDGVRFVRQSADQCSVANPVLLTVSGSPTLLPAGTAANLTHGVSPSGALLLSAPGQDGSWQLQYQAPLWLRYNWDPAQNGDELPSATAIFGRYRGNDRLIYWREQ